MVVCVIVSAIAAFALGVLPFMFSENDDRPIAVRMAEDAKRAGRVSTAELQNVEEHHGDAVGRGPRSFTATYQYTVHNKVYTYRSNVQSQEPPSQITVFYPKDRPSDAFVVRDQVMKRKTVAWYRFAAPPVVFVATYYVMSYLWT